MAKGIVYIMETAVSGLIKIGKTGTNNYDERMRFLEGNGYYNVSGLKKHFAIEVEDFDEKESLIHEIFQKQQIGNSELFALDPELVEQLLLAFDGKVVYPENIDKEKRFDKVATSRKKEKLFTFYRKGIHDGDIISFYDDPTISAKVVGERDVEYAGNIYKLAPLTRLIMEKLNRVSDSGSYQGSQYWNYKGTRLSKIKDVDIDDIS